MAIFTGKDRSKARDGALRRALGMERPKKKHANKKPKKTQKANRRTSKESRGLDLS